MVVAWTNGTDNRFVYAIDRNKLRKEEKEMGLSGGFLSWVGRTTTLTIGRNDNPKMREEDGKRSKYF